MAKYFIYEENIERLEFKIKTIENKCKRYGCEFTYHRTGNEVFKPVKDEEGFHHVLKFIEVEAEGKAVINGWRFVAVIQHEEAGNIVRQLDYAVEVPERYYHTSSICEHCNTVRNRKDTYLIYNDETKEFKQVGKSCLKDFTGGLDADEAARYISWFDKLIEGQKVNFEGGYFINYYEVEKCVNFAYQIVNLQGRYIKRDYDMEGERSTADTLLGVLRFLEKGNRVDKEIQEVAASLSIDNKEASEFAKVAINWISNSDATFGYLFDLKVAVSKEFIKAREIGLVASLVPTYMRELKNIAYQKKQKEEHAKKVIASDYQGNVGEKVTFTLASYKILSSYYDYRFGNNYFYGITDDQGNEYTWSTGKALNNEIEDGNIYEVTGTVKAHSTYRDVKQTQLTRCKIKLVKKAEEHEDEGTFDSSAIMNTMKLAEASI